MFFDLNIQGPKFTHVGKVEVRCTYGDECSCTFAVARHQQLKLAIRMLEGSSYAKTSIGIASRRRQDQEGFASFLVFEHITNLDVAVHRNLPCIADYIGSDRLFVLICGLWVWVACGVHILVFPWY